jgi:hypothetical protein
MEASGKTESAIDEQAEKVTLPPCPQCGSHKVGSIAFFFYQSSTFLLIYLFLKVKVTEIEAGDI